MTDAAVTDPGAFVLTFGKYQGRTLATAPRFYLRWLLDNATSLRPDTRQAIEAFLKQPRPPSPQGELPGTKPQRARRAGARSGVVAAATCARCGLPGSTARPLVHGDCVTDEVPF